MTTKAIANWRAVAIASTLAMTACAATPTQRATGEYLDDSALTAEVKTALIQSPDVKGSQVDVEVFRGVAQLSGFVDNAGAKSEASRLARDVNGITEVRNNINVRQAQ